MDLHQLKEMKKVNLFHDINDDEYAIMINCLSPQTRHFTKNEILLLTGDFIHHVGIIISGTACAYLDHISGNHTLISSLTPKSVFGDVLVSTKTQESPVTIYATSDVTATFIEYRKIYSMCAKACPAHRMFLQNMLRNIGDKYFRLFDRINILREKTLRAKILAYLHTLQPNPTAPFSVTIPFSKTMLANYLMANRSALSKELRSMENDGLIIVDGRSVRLLTATP